jgi:hypothetical protein
MRKKIILMVMCVFMFLFSVSLLRSDSENIALGANPLESDSGWGGGSYPWDITDGIRTYPDTWAHGLAFCGGTGNWCGEPCGWKQATLDLGSIKTFNRVLVYHHGNDHIPTAWLVEYWDGTNWQDVGGTSSVRWDLEEVINWSAVPTENLFPCVSGSKVRIRYNNCDITHGWIYEFEVYNEPDANQPPVAAAGNDRILESNDVATAVITGSASDPDPDDVLQFRWKNGETIVKDWTAVSENGSCPLELSLFNPGIGTYTLVLEVSDGFLSAADDMVLQVVKPKDNIIGSFNSIGVWVKKMTSGEWLQLSKFAARQLICGDINGNGQADLIGWWDFVSTDQPHGIWARYDNGIWATIFPNPAGLKWLALGDINGDGIMDIAGSFTYGVWWRESKTRAWHQISDQAADMIICGDFDQDGLADVAGYWNTAPAGIQVRYSADGQWETLIGTGNPIFLNSGDINGDGHMDLVGSWTFGVWWYNFSNELWTRLDAKETVIITTGDVNGQDMDDLVGIWKGLSGIWMRFSETASWQKITAPDAAWLTTGPIK